MNYKYSDICLCGCKFGDHDDIEGWCYGCIVPPMVLQCLEFKLDNLKYVEVEAKSRGL
jgi:hypothetical protein